jgi:cytoskeletal protein CcmA (bactofilin family)
MWGRKRPGTPPAAQPEPKDLHAIHPPKPAPSTSRLGANLGVKGEISGSEDLQVDGTVEGLVQLDEWKVTVGATGRLTADIIAREVVVFGSVKGNVRAKDKIEIKKDASVIGDLAMAQIVIEDGAHFKGSIEIERSAEKESDKDVFPPAA